MQLAQRPDELNGTTDKEAGARIDIITSVESS
jgi:hypothetical protein